MHRETSLSIDHPLVILKNSALILGGSIFLALMSQLAIPVPFSPIPITMQTLAIFLLGGTLKSKLGTLSVLAYLVQGTVGLPVFGGGIAQPLWFCDPRAGYLISFVPACFLIGKMIEARPQGGFFYVFLSLMAGQFVIFTIGASWLSLFVGPQKAYLLGVVPFLYGALCKLLTGSCFLRGYFLLTPSFFRRYS